MAMQEELARSGNAPTIDAPGSEEWWHSRSGDELQAIVQRGIQAGGLFIAAAGEMERRAKEAQAVREAEFVQEVRTTRRLRWEVWLLLVLAGATIVVVVLS